jgi:DNA-directed RNA polymerase subunit RPC12/RpoP
MKLNDGQNTWWRDCLGYTERHVKQRYSPQYKRINCPKCGRRVADADDEIDTEVHEINQTAAWRADYYVKCWKCKAQLGFKKLNLVS